MSLRSLVIQSQLVAPSQRSGLFHRPRVAARFLNVLDFPLTVVQAGTGYGKSTELSLLADKVPHLYWYTINGNDRDPLLFLANLFSAFNVGESQYGETALLALDDSWGRITENAITQLINTLTRDLHEDAILVLDDYHLVQEVAEINGFIERLVAYCPPHLHLVLSSRRMPRFDTLSKWRVKGQLLVIGRKELAFTHDEIEALFSDFYGYPLSEEDVTRLSTETEGWAIALQMIWQSLQSGAAASIPAVLERRPSTLEALFDYLAREVLAQQSEEVQNFLVQSSVLTEMDAGVCDVVLGLSQSLDVLEQLQNSGLFVVSAGANVYRYQHLFHDFLKARLSKDKQTVSELHLKAAAYYRENHPETAIYHLMKADHFNEAAGLLEKIGRNLVRLGRFDTLLERIGELPEDVRDQHPGLYLFLGDVRRLTSDFDEALEWYTAAEERYDRLKDMLGRSNALRGQAQVYLDTVRPLRADSLLEEALRLLEPQAYHIETAALLDLLAENKLNLGHPSQAKALHHEAKLLRDEEDPGDVYLEARSLLRTGYLKEARQLLEARVEDEQRELQRSRPQRFHRETMMLLSLITALQGDVDKTAYYAREGSAIGKRLDSTYVEAVGLFRLGHAYELQDRVPWDNSNRKAAISCYEEGIAKAKVFKVTRVQVEPLWGLARVYGYANQLVLAEQYASQAMEIALRAGDQWLYYLVKLSLGASLAMAGQAEQAGEHLLACTEGFTLVGDSHGVAASLLWTALNAWWSGEVERCMAVLETLLPLVKMEGYDTLLLQPTYLGLKDVEAVLPMLIEAYSRGVYPVFTEKLLQQKGGLGLCYHPGTTLSVRTLGLFEVWRGNELVGTNDWRREKARQLFQLFLTFRGKWMQREQIVDLLWPELDGDAAIRDFKVALNALNRALEPTRPHGTAPFFIARHEHLYMLNPVAKMVVDVDQFEEKSTSEDVPVLREALDLYVGDFLPDSLYNDWSMEMRSRLSRMYLETAERLAQKLLESGEVEELVEVCDLILHRDRYWEEAYRLMMQGYASKYNRSQLMHTYRRCELVLRDGLGIEPARETQSLYEKLMGNL